MKCRITTVPLREARDGRYLFAVCFLMYFMLYLGRLNLSAVMAEITTTGLMEKDAAGLIGTAFFATMGCGQIINGFLSDRTNPFRLVFISFVGSGLANVGMYLAAAYSAPQWVYPLIWAINGYAQSAVWPTMVRIFSTVLPEEMRVSAGSNILASTAVSMMAANLLYSSVMRYLRWQICFMIPGTLLVAAAVFWFFGTKKISRRTVCRDAAAEPEPSAGDASAERTKEDGVLMRQLAASGGFAIMAAMLLFVIVKESVPTWAPTLLTETFQTDPSFAVLISTVVSVAGIFGAAISRLVMLRLMHDELKSATLFFSVLSAALLLLALVGMKSIVLMLLLLAVILICLIGSNTMLGSLVPLRFGRFGIASTVAGIINAVACLGAALSSYLTGLMAKFGGWQVTIFFWLGLILASLAITLAVTRRWLRFKRS